MGVSFEESSTILWNGHLRWSISRLEDAVIRETDATTREGLTGRLKLFSQLYETEIIVFRVSSERRIGASRSAKIGTLLVSGEEICPVSAVVSIGRRNTCLKSTRRSLMSLAYDAGPVSKLLFELGQIRDPLAQFSFAAEGVTKDEVQKIG